MFQDHREGRKASELLTDDLVEGEGGLLGLSSSETAFSVTFVQNYGF